MVTSKLHLSAMLFAPEIDIGLRRIMHVGVS